MLRQPAAATSPSLTVKTFEVDDKLLLYAACSVPIVAGDLLQRVSGHPLPGICRN